MTKPYDLIEQGEIVRKHMKEEPDPIVLGRNLVSQSILASVLLAFSDSGFYEFIAVNKKFNVRSTADVLGFDAFTFESLCDHLIGCGLLALEVDGVCSVTYLGERYFNAYTRGVLNVYLGGYKTVLSHLSEVLTKKLPLSDRSLARSTRHAAAGTAQTTCGFTIPAVMETMKTIGSYNCLDLGCGTGDFLISLARQQPQAHCIGADMSADALKQAHATAIELAVKDRVSFYEAEVGAGPLPIPRESCDQINVITAMYIFHEFGRAGRDAIVKVVRALKDQFSGRSLLVLEVEGIDPRTDTEEIRRLKHFGKLDYRLIHLLSGQGLPRSQRDWCDLFREAGCEVFNEGIKTGGSILYGVKL